jgi:hypothetical protein
MQCNAEAERKKKLPMKEGMVPCNEHFHQFIIDPPPAAGLHKKGKELMQRSTQYTTSLLCNVV